MPKRKADSILKGTPKLPRDLTVTHHSQANYIEANSFITTTLYDYCRDSKVSYIIDRTYRYSKCASCTYAGRVYKRDFHTGWEWDLLRRAEDKLSLNIEKNKNKLDLLEPELSNLQSRLTELY
jgi:hypothetical protein